MSHHFCSNCRQLFQPKGAPVSASGAARCPHCGAWNAMGGAMGGANGPAPIDWRLPMLLGSGLLGLLLVGVVIVVIVAARARFNERAAQQAARERARMRNATAAAPASTASNSTPSNPLTPAATAPPAIPLPVLPPNAGMAQSATPAPYPSALATATPATVPRLAYRWIPGAEYACHFSIEAKATSESKKIQGMTVYVPLADLTPGADAVAARGAPATGLTSISFRGHCAHDKSGETRLSLQTGSETDSGQLLVDSLGRVTECSSVIELPYWMTLLGGVGIEPLSPDSSNAWSIRTNTTLQVIDEREARDPLAFHFPLGGADFEDLLAPRSRRMRERYLGDRGLAPPEENRRFPVVETLEFRVAAVSGDTVEITKTYDLKSQAVAGGTPHLHVHGNGKLIFDAKLGMTRSLAYVGAFDVTENGETSRLPITINYTMKAPDEHAIDLAKARERAAARDAASAIADLAPPPSGPTSTFTPPPRRPRSSAGASRRDSLPAAAGGLDQFDPE